jgi:tetratricopeptide (TPR) repeat protein
VLRQGAAVQDRQMARGDRYPGLGLHWLLGLVRLRQGDHEEALGEFDREMKRANLHRLYGREYKMSALHARGLCLLGMGKASDAITSLEEGLELYADHAPTHVALAMALQAAGFRDRAESIRRKLPPILETLRRWRPIEARLVESQQLAVDGSLEPAADRLCELLETAPPGFAAWTLPVDPLFAQLHDNKRFADVLHRLGERAR